MNRKRLPCDWSPAKIVGRLVDHSDQVPVAGAEIRFEVLPHEEFPPQLPSITTDTDGRFEQPAVLPGANYTIIAEHPSIGSDFRRVARGLTVSPGETIDLGTIDVTSDKRPEPVRTKAVASAGSDGSAEVTARNANTEPPAAPVAPLSTITGHVALPDGRPAAGAHVAAIAKRIQQGSAGDRVPQSEVLAEGTTDDQGNYSLNFNHVDPKTHPYANLIARMDGYAIAWQRFNVDAASIEASLTLTADEPVRGRLVGIEGQPAAGVRLVVRSVDAKSAAAATDQARIWYQGGDQAIPAAWLAAVTSDAAGRFQLGGVPAGRSVALATGGSEQFAPQEISLNAGEPEPQSSADATDRTTAKHGARRGSGLAASAGPVV